MKLGLLVVVAVAVLLPGFSESRIVSTCELRDKLRELIQLPRALEEGILATVICEVDRMSHLNTSLVNGLGDHMPTKPEPPLITGPFPTGITEMTTIEPTTNSSTDTQLTNTAATTVLLSNSPGGGMRPKREFDSSGEEETKGGLLYNGSQIEEEGETSTEDEPGYIMKSRPRPRSLGLYGLFQLSDTDFCDSGYRWSRNVCRTSCTAFTDDDITDDIACVVNTDHWRDIWGRASDACLHVSSNFFQECN